MQKKELESGVLSIPKILLDEAGIPHDYDLTIETIPGVILIGVENPLNVANEPLLCLFAAMGITPEDVIEAIEKGGLFDE